MNKILMMVVFSLFSLSAYCGSQIQNLNTKLIEQTIGLKGKLESNVDNTFTIIMLKKNLPSNLHR